MVGQLVDRSMLLQTYSNDAFILQQLARRSALGLMAGAAALLTRTKPSEAAFGDAANVFGKYDTFRLNVDRLCIEIVLSLTCDSLLPIAWAISCFRQNVSIV